MTNRDENHLDNVLQALSPRVGSLGYCKHCGEPIIVRATSRASVWTHRHTGLILCNVADAPGAFATPDATRPATSGAEPELERLRRLPDTAPLDEQGRA